MAYKKNMKKRGNYAGSMISEDMSAPYNLPQSVVRRNYDTDGQIAFNYEGNGDAMYAQVTDDIKTANRIKATRRY